MAREIHQHHAVEAAVARWNKRGLSLVTGSSAFRSFVGAMAHELAHAPLRSDGMATKSEGSLREGTNFITAVAAQRHRHRDLITDQS
jgi:hypothetical protein